jgi:hypothetical protein
MHTDAGLTTIPSSKVERGPDLGTHFDIPPESIQRLQTGVGQPFIHGIRELHDHERKATRCPYVPRER